MNATIETASLLKALRILVKIAKNPFTKYASPALRRIRLSVGSSEHIVLSATDLTTFVELPIPARVTNSDAGGALSFDAKALLDIVKALPKKGDATITGEFGAPCSVGPVKLDSADPADHPDRPQRTGFTPSLIASSDDIGAAFKAVLPAVSTDACRAQLTGVTLSKDGNAIIGCNGKQLALVQGHDIAVDAILPRSAVDSIISVAGLQAGIGTIGVCNADKMAFADLPGGIVTCRCLEGQFPEYLGLLPTEQGARGSAEAKALLNTIALAIAPLAKDARRIQLTIGNGDIYIGSASVPRQLVQSSGAPTYDDAEHTAVYSADYLTAVLKAFKGQRVTLSIHDDSHRGMLEITASMSNSHTFRWICMPIRIETPT